MIAAAAAAMAVNDDIYGHHDDRGDDVCTADEDYSECWATLEKVTTKTAATSSGSNGGASTL